VKRPGTGIPPKELKNLIGQRTLQPLKKDQVIHWEQIGQPEIIEGKFIGVG